MKPPVITAGPSEPGSWCGSCQQATRCRVPLLDGAGGTLAVLEICPGCGTGTIPHAEIVPPPPGPRASFPQNIARAVHRRLCHRSGRRSLACAWRDCQWPGRWSVTHEWHADEGITTYVFCRRSHRARWLTSAGR